MLYSCTQKYIFPSAYTILHFLRFVCRVYLLSRSRSVVIMANNASLIETGNEFSNYEEFLRAFHDFCNTSYQALTIVINKKK